MKKLKHIAVEWGESGEVNRKWFFTRKVAQAFADSIGGRMRLSLVGKEIHIRHAITKSIVA